MNYLQLQEKLLVIRVIFISYTESFNFRFFSWQELSVHHFSSHSPEKKVLAECSDEKLTSPSAELGSESNVSQEIQQQTIFCSVSVQARYITCDV